jgi:DNA-binding MarR family transcriptional regulator
MVLPFDEQVTASYIVQVSETKLPYPAAPTSTGVATAPPPTADPVAPPAAATTSATRQELLGAIAEGVARLASRQRCAVAQRVHHSGISLGHVQILWILQEHGPLPVSRLAAWLGIGVPNATGLLDRMEQRGLVERVRDVDDRRVVLACATDLGRATVAELDGWRADLVDQVLAPLPDAQLAAVRDAIREAIATGPAHPAPGPQPQDHPAADAAPKRSRP